MWKLPKPASFDRSAVPLRGAPRPVRLWEPCNKQDTGTSDLISLFFSSVSSVVSLSLRVFPFFAVPWLTPDSFVSLVPRTGSSRSLLRLSFSLFTLLSLLLFPPFPIRPRSPPPFSPSSDPSAPTRAFSLSRFNVVFFCFPPISLYPPVLSTHLSASPASASSSDLLSRPFSTPDTVLLSRCFFIPVRRGWGFDEEAGKRGGKPRATGTRKRRWIATVAELRSLIMLARASPRSVRFVLSSGTQYTPPSKYAL